MRAGCASFLMMLLAVTFLAVGVPWLVTGILEQADPGPVASVPADVASAERKLSPILSGPSRHGRPGSPRQAIVLSESEVNGLLGRHLPDLAGVPLQVIRLRLKDQGRVELAARTTVRMPLAEVAGSETVDLLPSRWLAQPLWVRLDASAHLEQATDGTRRYLRLDIDRFHLGRRRLPAFLLRVFLDPTTLGLLRWPLPHSVDDFSVERGRVVIRTRSSL